MWRIIDHTEGRIRAILSREWSAEAAAEALERRHSFGIAADIAHELEYLGFERYRDFDVRPIIGSEGSASSAVALAR